MMIHAPVYGAIPGLIASKLISRRNIWTDPPQMMDHGYRRPSTVRPNFTILLDERLNVAELTHVKANCRSTDRAEHCRCDLRSDRSVPTMYQHVSIGWVQVLFQVAIVVACGLGVFIVRRAAEQDSESRAFRVALISTIIGSIVLASSVMLGLQIAVSSEVRMPTHNPFFDPGSGNSHSGLFLLAFAIGNCVAGVCGLLLGACAGSISASLYRSRIKRGQQIS